MSGFDPRALGAPATRRGAELVAEPVLASAGTWPVRRSFPTPYLDGLDPFLAVERWGPVALGPGESAAVEPRPLLTVEALWLVRAGAVRVRASRGPLAEVLAGPGDAVWLRGGDGVVHDVVCAAGPDGGRADLALLWADAPARRGAVEPELSLARADAVPVVPLGEAGARVRVIAGRFGEAHGPVVTGAELQVLHLFLGPGEALAHRLPGAWRVAALVLDGFGRFGHGDHARPAKAGEVVRWDVDGTELRVASDGPPVELLLFAGPPLRQPVVRYGPLVARSEAAIREAMARLQRGRMGQLG